ncbi:MAG: Eco57I restriction-modification methylase domain-containing protein [Alphaproteobacteria bacterium]|nr:Eco57I restriction-modification methylase domain-containing protein [Alphaproteobacteria bacterium]MBU2269845.1 Eco57I restriction-modification methylase domain-containing protein [Alphaproteobacteria bacterium]MBU2419955.1 Eco57I restriction-modification methylase domain-containing protein [Alphaproteobacteria bacterium]
MTDTAPFALLKRNPDVLTCIANLSNDEVFTPPEFAHRMLDTLAEGWASANDGANIWADSSVTFLDPCTKSGVFLREIAKRMIDGLADEIPDLQKRVDHILTKQVFGVGITQLTALLARRSLYCSKWANSEHSIATGFDDEHGNVWFERTEHVWESGRCRFCGATIQNLDRGDASETYAYPFIHTDDPATLCAKIAGAHMQFDVIIGNPPYQLSDASDSASASPIYQKFIEQSMMLEPRYLSMVVPSRWFGGGKGLDEFRAKMLKDQRLQTIVDYIIDKDAFPKVNINGGLNYFLWGRDHVGDCTIITVEPGGLMGEPATRPLDEFDVLIRRNGAVPILRKVLAKASPTFDRRVSSRKPFGLPTNFFGADSKSASRTVKLHSSGRTTWIKPSEVRVNWEWIDRWKVLIGRATDGNEKYPLPIWDQRGPFVAGPGEACTETCLVAAVASNKVEAERIAAYMRTKLFRFLVSLRKMTQDNKADIFAFVPDLTMDRIWTDAQLYKEYGLTADEQAYIDSLIRSMEAAD